MAATYQGTQRAPRPRCEDCGTTSNVTEWMADDDCMTVERTICDGCAQWAAADQLATNHEYDGCDF